MTGAPVLEIRDVSVRFGGLVAVDRVSLSFAPRSLAGIIGPNGAGKTTFFHALSGIVRPTEGDILLAGRKMSGLAPHRFARAGIGRTFQTPRTFPDLTVAENLAFGAAFGGRHRDRSEAVLTDTASILDFIGMNGQADMQASGITPARQRLLEIGMALSLAPRVLLLDEVAAGLTEAEVLETARLIRRCSDDLGLAVLWIEHAVGTLMRFVDRVIVLNRGALLADGTPEAVARDPAVIDAYLGTGPHP